MRFGFLRRTLPVLVLLFVGPVVSLPQASPQEEFPPIRVDVRLVNVFVNVTDEHRALVGGLNKDDFVMMEDGRPQKISVFEKQSAMPLSVVLAIDTSGSVRKDLPIESGAAHRFVLALLRTNDQMRIMEFSTDVREVVPFTSNLNKIDRGLDNLRNGPATALYDAIYLACQNLAGKQGRKVLVLVSDGGNTVKGVDYAKALESALRNEVMVYSLIDVPISASAGRNTGGEHAMITLSEQTGGRHYYAAASALDQAFQKVADDLHTQYLLGYYAARREGDSEFRRIDVKLKTPGSSNYSLRHRTGYYSQELP
jgi:Ca-activated chloride channel family protein